MKGSIKVKLIVISLLLLAIPSLVIGIVSYNSCKQGLDEQGRTTLKNNVRMAIKLIDSVNRDVKNGHISLEDAQEQVKTYLIGEMKEDGTRQMNSRIDFGENGYFYVTNEKGILIGHPTDENKNGWELQDENGNYFIQESIELANNGGGFIEYDYPLPGQPNVIEPKILYAEKDPNWGWIVTGTSYMQAFNSHAKQISHVVIITLSLSIILGFAIIWIFSNRMANPIKELTNHAVQVANGDLTVKELHINRHDEIGKLTHSFNQMVQNLKNLIQHVSNTSQQVASSSEQLTASSEQTSKATEEISQSIQEIANGSEKSVVDTQNATQIVKDMSQGIEQVTENIQSVTESAIDTSNTASEGNNTIQQSIDQMNAVNNFTNEMEKIVYNLGDKSKEISEVISLITDIAEQTNLLALNAAIEAARAGEHGKGFAIVADEVRKLAEQSSTATKKVENLISEIQNGVNQTVSAMNQNQEVVKKGLTFVNQAGDVFTHIVEDINRVSSQMQDVSAAIEEMNAGTNNLVQTIENSQNIAEESAGYSQNVASAAEEQTASMEEVASSAENLANMADELQKAVQKFKI